LADKLSWGVKETTVALGSDHTGLTLKNEIIAYLQKRGLNCRDFGTFSQESCDYPDIAYEVALAVSKGECEKGILICGTGIGMAIAANKVKGIRAALCHDPLSAKLSRQHNDANILTLGERIIGVGLALEIVDVWLNASFGGERHQRRVAKIQNIENDEGVS